jgi:hypothetical protein
MLDANQIKIRLIDQILNTSDANLIASEASFYHGYRKADLLSLKNDRITAYEIKSDKDNLKQLSEQIIDYSSTFSYCYLVTTQRHLQNARQLIPNKVGLILVSQSEISVIRKPLENRRLSKHSLVLGLSQKLITDLVDSKRQKLSIYEKREYLEQNVPLTILKRGFISSVFEKYQPKYLNFLFDRGQRTTLTDLYYLQSN